MTFTEKDLLLAAAKVERLHGTIPDEVWDAYKSAIDKGDRNMLTLLLRALVDLSVQELLETVTGKKVKRTIHVWELEASE